MVVSNYNNFINEKLSIFGELKNLFSKMLINTSDDVKKPIDDLLNKFNTTYKPDDFKRHLTTYLKIQSDNMTKTLNDSNNISNIIKITNDNLIGIYCSLDIFTRSMNDDNYTFEKIFEESNNERVKKLFVLDEKFFIKNVELFSVELIIELSKSLGINKDDIYKQWQEYKSKNENINYNIYNYNQFIIEQEQNDQQNDQQKEQEQKEIQENLVKLKTNIIKWFDIFLYKILKDVVKKQPEQDVIKTLKSNINKMSITDNKDSVSKILNAITQIDDKNTLIELRDFLSSKGLNINKDIAPL